jgi:hypothetical protein
MEIKEAIQVLKDHNVWRRFDDEKSEGPKMTDPKKLGIAIDTVVTEFENLFISGVRLSLPDEDEINSMQLEMDCPTPNEEEYTTSGFKSGVRWLKNTIERQMLKGNEA